ncbi:MAG: HAD family hydrolase [Phycisphaerae bacterium]|nr:HAD family hydrolase [Phycisphaerae bacterium]
MTAATERRLAVFDIDGTLTQTAHVDESCYAEAIRLEWNVENISTDWGAYEHSTDNAIASEVSRTRRGRDATTEELASLRDRFVGLLRAQLAREPGLFRETPGGARVFAELRARGWDVAIATGGWTPSARLKLATAGISTDRVAAAFACDARPRADIIRLAMSRADALAGNLAARVAYLGDGRWDLTASRELGIGFVGIGTGVRAQSLAEAGAAHVFADFYDVDRLVAALERVAAPPCTKPDRCRS